MGRESLDAALITTRANVRYLSGFTGTNGWLLLAPSGNVLFTDPRYQEQAQREVVGADVIVGGKGLVEALQERLAASDWRRLGFEAENVTVDLHGKLGEGNDVEWVPLRNFVESLRQRKGSDEVEAIRKALRLTEEALVEVVGALEPGCTERELAAELDHTCRRRGAEGMAFETIVASGPRTSLPHGVASDRRLRAGEPVMIDMGCVLDGYCSDLTRMVWLGAAGECGGIQGGVRGEDPVDGKDGAFAAPVAPPPEWLRLHALVARAQEAAIAAVRPGVAAVEVDRAARRVITDGGFGAAFRHGTGHGVGLEVHEAPAVSERSDDVLEEGMVITIEPAIYQEATAGVRIEDMVCVSEEGYERLTALSTDPMLAGIP